jgi:hypothetical protein
MNFSAGTSLMNSLTDLEEYYAYLHALKVQAFEKLTFACPTFAEENIAQLFQQNSKVAALLKHIDTACPDEKQQITYVAYHVLLGSTPRDDHSIEAKDFDGAASVEAYYHGIIDDPLQLVRADPPLQPSADRNVLT